MQNKSVVRTRPAKWTKTFLVRTDEALYDGVKALCDQYSMSMASFIRMSMKRNMEAIKSVQTQ